MRSFDSRDSSVTAPKAYVGLFGDNSVAVLDTATKQVMKTIRIPTGPHGLAMTPDGKRVCASSDGNSSVSVIDTSTDEVIACIDVGSMPHGLAITPDGRRVLVAGSGSNQVEAIDTRNNRIVWKTSVAQPHNLGIAPDGRTAYAAKRKAIRPWRYSTSPVAPKGGRWRSTICGGP
jgi:YVTN family beta-propeller protein